jgi:hypothetical protein
MSKEKIIISICSNGKKQELEVNSLFGLQDKINEMSLKLDMKKGDDYDIVISKGEKVLMHRFEKAI